MSTVKTAEERYLTTKRRYLLVSVILLVVVVVAAPITFALGPAAMRVGVYAVTLLVTAGVLLGIYSSRHLDRLYALIPDETARESM